MTRYFKIYDNKFGCALTTLAYDDLKDYDAMERMIERASKSERIDMLEIDEKEYHLLNDDFWYPM